MTAEEDPFLSFDAAYVLGALSPEDRQAFEQHLRTCDDCARSVRELAGLPGLLSQIMTPELTESEPPPPELLPSVLKKTKRSRRRRLFVTAGALVTAAAACVALVVVLTEPSEAPVPGVAMTALGAFPVQANVVVTDQAWGMELEMTCSYRGGRANGDYVLVAVQRDGKTAELATWQAVPQYTARIVLGTPLHRADVQALEIRTKSGLALLRLTT
ncbi:Putative zinc-finger [Amycolatopsis xylanica]|uniref:Putative zinc-finger n=1 Tax=Amycolatopsis xylanica TaxID=589385 RepID=A0A1H3J891_9PSEU|nr:zf-HC2 domain-containing protein [Amycolatopsis xylanica]SDY35789.1 Putative zinc-finger [Amycolatopsis xylanica]